MSLIDWIWERPTARRGSGDQPLKTNDHSESDNASPAIKSTYFQTREPRDNDPGAIEPVFYVVVGDVVKLCGENGELMGRSRQLNGEAAEIVASRLGLDAWSAKTSNEFNGRLRYRPLSIA